MDVLNKLQNEVKRLDRRVKWSLCGGYNEEAAHYRDVLEAAVTEIAHLRTPPDAS